MGEFGSLSTETQPPIRVLIADDQFIFREGLSAFVRSDPQLCLVSTVSSTQEAIYTAAQLNPDVIVMDLSMPQTDGLTAARIIQEDHPHIKIIILSAHIEYIHIHRAFSIGVAGYLTKDISANELANAIKAVHQGEPQFHPQTALYFINYNQAHSITLKITKREEEILHLIRLGLTNRSIAKNLRVSYSTVKFHLLKLIRKLNLSSRTQLLHFALTYFAPESEYLTNQPPK